MTLKLRKMWLKHFDTLNTLAATANNQGLRLATGEIYLQGNGLKSAVILRNCSKCVFENTTYNSNRRVNDTTKFRFQWMK